MTLQPSRQTEFFPTSSFCAHLVLEKSLDESREFFKGMMHEMNPSKSDKSIVKVYWKQKFSIKQLSIKLRLG